MIKKWLRYCVHDVKTVRFAYHHVRNKIAHLQAVSSFAHSTYGRMWASGSRSDPRVAF